MNIARIKRGMTGWIRRWNKAHPKDGITLARMSRSPWWGVNAHRNFWRMTRHVKGLRYAPYPTPALSRLLFPLTYSQLVVRVLKAKVGVHEHGYSNSGKWVDIFLHAVYLPGGYAWCAAFAIWAQIRAAIINDVMDDTTNDYEVLRDVFHDLCYGNAAYVPNLARAFRERRKAHGWKAIPVAWSDVRAGDIIICSNGGHVETAIGPCSGGKAHTIGGNTSATGSQDNGGEVVEKWRAIGSEATSAGRIVPPK